MGRQSLGIRILKMVQTKGQGLSEGPERNTMLHSNGAIWKHSAKENISKDVGRMKTDSEEQCITRGVIISRCSYLR